MKNRRARNLLSPSYFCFFTLSHFYFSDDKRKLFRYFDMYNNVVVLSRPFLSFVSSLFLSRKLFFCRSRRLFILTRAGASFGSGLRVGDICFSSGQSRAQNAERRTRDDVQSGFVEECDGLLVAAVLAAYRNWNL